MSFKLEITSLVILVISIVLLACGAFLLLKIYLLTEVVPEYPSMNEMQVSINPISSQKGTVFLINAVYIKQREQQDLNLIIEKEGEVSSLKLYDDGKHYDQKKRDGVYGGLFDSTNASIGKYNVRIQDAILASFDVSESGCEVVYGNGPVKFVVLPYGYDDYFEFKEDLKRLITSENSLLRTEPFSSKKDSFSFLTVNNTKDLACEIGCKEVSTLVCCDNTAVYEEASKCEYNAIFLLINDAKRCGSASSYAKICAKNSDANLILMHELGHSFADLADEYVYSDYFGEYSVGEVDEVNCDKEGCAKWKDITTGCFAGCTYSSLYRPEKQNSVMYDLYPKFNLVCLNHIDSIIDNYVESKNKEEKNSPKKSYFVNLNYDQGQIIIKNIFLKPISSNQDFRKSDYSVQIKDNSQNQVFSSWLYLPDKIYPLPGTNASIIYEKKFDFAVTLPYYPKAEELVIYRKENPVAQAPLEAFLETCGDKICQSYENRLSCSSDCGIKDNFCETSICDPDCKSQENCEKERRNRLWLSIGLIAISIISFVIIMITGFKKDEFY